MLNRISSSLKSFLPITCAALELKVALIPKLVAPAHAINSPTIINIPYSGSVKYFKTKGTKKREVIKLAIMNI